jgi:hypothetical protein
MCKGSTLFEFLNVRSPAYLSWRAQMGTDWFRDYLEGPVMKFAIPPPQLQSEKVFFWYLKAERSHPGQIKYRI